MAKHRSLLKAATDAAKRIEAFAAKVGATYHAAQDCYGVGVEVLAEEESDEWEKAAWWENDSEPTAVRLFDCDGVRGRECHTVAEVDAELRRWLKAIQAAVPWE